MSYTLPNAKVYIAQILGAQLDANMLVAAGDKLAVATDAWNVAHNWTFLLTDTSQPRTIADAVTSGANANLTSASNAFDFVNNGQGISGTNIQAGTVVQAKTNAGALVMSLPSTGTVSGVTFTADIPIIAHVQDYDLPKNHKDAYTARLLTNPRVLEFIKHREVDRKVPNQTIEGVASHYTTYNPAGFSATGQDTMNQKKLRLFKIPSSGDVLREKYYRLMDRTHSSGTVDIYDPYLFPLLNLARVYLLMDKDAEDPRIANLERHAMHQLEQCISDDDAEGEDEDVRMISQQEANARRPVDLDIWGEY